MYGFLVRSLYLHTHHIYDMVCELIVELSLYPALLPRTAPTTQWQVRPGGATEQIAAYLRHIVNQHAFVRHALLRVVRGVCLELCLSIEHQYIGVVWLATSQAVCQSSSCKAAVSPQLALCGAIACPSHLAAMHDLYHILQHLSHQLVFQAVRPADHTVFVWCV